MTILELLAWAGDSLKSADATRTVPQNPRLDAQVLLSFVLGVNSAHLFTHGDEIVPTEAIETYQRLIARRARHEPVAYLTQTKAFFRHDFFVNNHVLIPRPDTEIMVEAAINFVRPQSVFIDIGTGSGAIAISCALATQRPTFAIDVDAGALAVAQHNASTLQAPITFAQGSLFTPFTEYEVPSDHLIVTANLPYLTPWQWQALDADVKEYEPKLALVGGADGLALYDELCTQIRAYLHEQSRLGKRIAVDLLIEIDPSQKLTAPALLKSHFPDARIQLTRDMSGKERLVTASIY